MKFSDAEFSILKRQLIMTGIHDAFIIIGSIFILSAPVTRGADTDHWPMFRGVNACGVAAASLPPTEFGPEKNELWRIDTPKGHSSPCVWDDLIFLTAADPEAKKLETLAISRSKRNIAWRSVVEVPRLEKHHKVSTPATATCATDGKRVVSFFGSFGLICYDYEGKEFWRYEMPVYNAMNGSGTSPLLHNGVVYLHREDATEQALIALNAETGAEKWKRKHPNAQPNLYGVASTPIYWDAKILLHRGGSISAHEVETGEVSWFVPAHTTGCSTPVIADNKLVAGTWNNAGEADQVPPLPEFETLVKKCDSDKDGKLSDKELKGFPILIRPEIDPGLGGNMPLTMAFGFFDTNNDKLLDEQEWKEAVAKSSGFLTGQKHGILAIDLSKGTPSESSILWKIERNVPEVPSPLVHEGRVYLVRNGGILMCVELDSGKILYQERLGAPGPYYASPIACGPNIYFTSGAGKIVVLKRGPTFEVIAANDLKEDTFATPAAVGNQLLVRTSTHLYAFERSN